MTTAQTQLDPKSYVARVIEELERNPEARALLLRALLTDEFLEMPTRLERVENTVGELVEGQKAIVRRVSNLERDVSVLKGDSLEWKLFRRVRPLVSQMMNLRRCRIMMSSILGPRSEFEGALEGAADKGIITYDQEMRVNLTDFVLRAEWNEDRSQVWIAVEVSNNIGQRDIERVKESADALGAAFGEAVGVVAGYRIDPRDQQRADDSGVRILLVNENFWME